MSFRDHPPHEPPAHASAPSGDDEPAHARPDALRLRLDALVARGAEGFDPAELRYLQGLLARASRAPTEEASALRSRLDARLATLDAALSAERARAHEALDRAATAGVAIDDLRAVIASGDPRAAALEAEARLLATRLAPRTAREPATQSRSTLPPPARLAELDALAAGLRLDVALARAASSARVAEGPYNPTAIAARLFATLRQVAPGYLSAVARELDDLGAVASCTADVEARPVKRKK